MCWRDQSGWAELRTEGWGLLLNHLRPPPAYHPFPLFIQWLLIPPTSLPYLPGPGLTASWNEASKECLGCPAFSSPGLILPLLTVASAGYLSWNGGEVSILLLLLLPLGILDLVLGLVESCRAWAQ